QDHDARTWASRVRHRQRGRSARRSRSASAVPHDRRLWSRRDLSRRRGCEQGRPSGARINQAEVGTVIRLLLLVALVVSVRAQTGASQRAPARAINSDSARAIDRVFDRWRAPDGPGCALGVSRNGTLVYERGYGMANLETSTPITPSSIFEVASVAKQFT